MKHKINIVIFTMIISSLMVFAIGSVAAQDETDESGPDVPPFLGLTFIDMEGNIVVTDVLTNGPAAEAGLMNGDIIVSIDGEEIAPDAFRDQIMSYSVGDTVTISVERDGEMIDVEVVLGQGTQLRNRGQGQQPVPPRFEFRSRSYLGIRLNPDVAIAGAMIAEVMADSPAAEAGLLADDVIVAVDETPIADPRDVIAAIANYVPGDTVAVTILRDDEEQTFEIMLGELPFDQQNSGPRIFEFGRDDSEIAFDEENGVWVIITLDENSPLAESGLQSGDRITAIDGEAFTGDGLEFMRGVAETVILTVEREGEIIELDVPGAILPILFVSTFDRMMIPGEMMPFEFNGPRPPFELDGPNGPNGSPGRPNGSDLPFRHGQGRTVLGVAFETLNADIAAENELDLTEGALVKEVLAESPAEAAGLQAGDVITAVDGDVVDAERTLSDRLWAYEPGDTITLSLMRDGETLEVEVTLDNVQVR